MRIVLAGICLIAALFTTNFATTTTAQDTKKPKFKLTDAEKEILDLTNQARKKNNLAPLKASPKLFGMARSYSAKMAKLQKLDHYLGGQTYKDRLKIHKYNWKFVGENLGWGPKGYKITQIFDLWMKSKFHRKNILAKQFTEIGLGQVVDEKGDAWYTQVYGTPIKK